MTYLPWTTLEEYGDLGHGDADDAEEIGTVGTYEQGQLVLSKSRIFGWLLLLHLMTKENWLWSHGL